MKSPKTEIINAGSILSCWVWRSILRVNPKQSRDEPSTMATTQVNAMNERITSPVFFATKLDLLCGNFCLVYHTRKFSLYFWLDGSCWSTDFLAVNWTLGWVQYLLICVSLDTWGNRYMPLLLWPIEFMREYYKRRKKLGLFVQMSDSFWKVLQIHRQIFLQTRLRLETVTISELFIEKSCTQNTVFLYVKPSVFSLNTCVNVSWP